jgi:hypothetical protein
LDDLEASTCATELSDGLPGDSNSATSLIGKEVAQERRKELIRNQTRGRRKEDGLRQDWTEIMLSGGQLMRLHDKVGQLLEELHVYGTRIN